MRSVLNTYSSVTIIVVVVGGTVLVAMACVVGARRLFPNLADGPFEETADGLRVVYELIFALILAFVIASVLDTFSNADSTVSSEATTLANIKRGNQALPVVQQLRLDEGLNQYVHAIVEDEFVTMRDGKESARAAAALEGLFALYQSYSPPPAAGAEEEFYGLAVGKLDQAVSARRERLALSAEDLPSLLRVFLPLGAVLLLILEYRPKMTLKAQLVHVGLLAVVVSFAYLLTILLNYPFAGEVTVGTDPFKQGSLAEFWANQDPHVVAKGETTERLTPDKLAGVWTSDAFGEIVFRQEGGEVRGVYRTGQGTVVGKVDPDGVFRGWWCQAPSRRPLDDAGDVAWTLVKSSGQESVYGSWRNGTEEPFVGGWDLERIGGPEPPDLKARFADAAAFCRHP